MGLSKFDERAPTFETLALGVSEGVTTNNLTSHLETPGRFDAIFALSDDHVAHRLQIQIAGTPVLSVTVDAGNALGLSPPVDIAALLASEAGLADVVLPAGFEISVSLSVAVTDALKHVYVVAAGGQV